MSKNDKTTNTLQLLKMFTRRQLSRDTQKKISLLIKKARLSGGDEAAETKAEELTALIEQYKTDEAILEAIKGM